jgi:hypothetical protein
MQAEVVSLDQKFDFQSGSMQYVLVLKLPNDREISVNVDDETANQLVLARLSPDDAPAPMQPHVPSQLPQTFVDLGTGEQAAVFGGEQASAYQLPQAAPVVQQPAQPVRAPRVDRDDWGYPVIRDPNAVPVSSALGERDPDEDGVGSI